MNNHSCSRRYSLFASAAMCVVLTVSCTRESVLVDSDAGPAADGAIRQCESASESWCLGDVARTCVSDGIFLSSEDTDCALDGRRCAAGACVLCIADQMGCFEGDAARCRADQSGWDVTTECDLTAGLACSAGICVDLCAEAVIDRSYVGCEFYPVDLDTRGLYTPPFGIIVSNPNPFVTRVLLEVDDAAPGEAPSLRTLDEVEVPPFDLESFSLPERRRVDGHPGAGGTWVETGSALSRAAYHVRARHPVIAYQFNPLAQADVFSNDASLLLPTSALGTRTTVIGWPQTLSSLGTPEQRSGEDYRATLTLVGTAANTDVTVRFGAAAKRVLRSDGPGVWGPGETYTVRIGPFDVVNLETDAFLGDFTGTTVESTAGVVVYSGSEGADAPFYNAFSSRLCCADHLEEQLQPDSALGEEFVLARTPNRARAINDALSDATFALPDANEYEIVRVLAVAAGTTTITTSLAAPYGTFTLQQGEVATLTLDRDTELRASQPVSVIQVLVGQAAAGIPFQYPGGDPAMVVVPPSAQFRNDYVFLTPSTYGFDAITIVAPPDATISLDGVPLPSTCESLGLDGESPAGSPPTAWVVHRCALSFPEVTGDFSVRAGVQGDGVHRVRANRPVGVVVSGFDAFVSYAYAAGMNVQVLR